MNKIKLMYDVARTMRDKEVFNGTLNVEGRKDQKKVFSLANEFEKNTLTGEVKARVSTESDYEGRKFRHESSTDFNGQCLNGRMFHGMMRHKHPAPGSSSDSRPEGEHCCGIKGRLSRLMFMLYILNNIEVNEQEDKSLLLSLNLDEIPEDIKKTVYERVNNVEAKESHKYPYCFKEFHNLENPSVGLNIRISKNNEIEKAVLTVAGKQKSELEETHDVDIKAELCFTW